MTILGTRPEIIRLSRIIPRLDDLCDHVLVHTGQNFERSLGDVFFEELGVRQPDHLIDSRAESAVGQIAKILVECERLLQSMRPDRLLLLGDTNSALSAIVAKRLGIPVYHMEAGNRCFDDRVPEEVNRRIIDHSSDVLMPYTERSRYNLLREGIASDRIYVTGNPIKEVLDHYAPRIDASTALETLGVEPGRYFLVTLHRAENVDVPDRLDRLVEALYLLGEQYGHPVLVSLHPRTRSQLERRGKTLEQRGVRAFEPLGLFDFVRLQRSAFCVLTDSGTVQEECCIFNVPNVTVRDVTERPETVEAGSNIISGVEPDDIRRCVRVAIAAEGAHWQPPREYQVEKVSPQVVRILLGRS